jgi:hypothetical protein
MGALSLLLSRVPTIANDLRKDMKGNLVALVSHHIQKLVETRVNEGAFYSPDYGAKREWVRIPGEAPMHGPQVGVPATRQQFLNDLQAVRQQTLTRPLHVKERKGLIVECRREGQYESAAVLSSYSGEIAVDSWIGGAVFISLQHRLKADDYARAMRLKLHVILPPGLLGPRHCVKCKGLGGSILIDTAEGQAHLLTCKEASKQVNHRHDMVRTAIFRCCKALGLKAEEEVEIRNEGKMRYDVDVKITVADVVHFIEITVVTAQAPSHTRGKLYKDVYPHLRDKTGSAYDGEYTTSRQEDLKIARAAKSLTPQQMGYFHVAAFGANGKFGRGAKALFRMLKRELEKKHGEGSPLVQKALTALYREIGTALWRGAARIIGDSLDATREIIRQGELDEQGDEDGDDDNGGGGGGDSQLDLEPDGGVAYRGNEQWQGDSGNGGGNDAGDGEDGDDGSDQGYGDEGGGRGLGYSQGELADDLQRDSARQLVLNSSTASSVLSGSTESEHRPGEAICSHSAASQSPLLMVVESSSGVGPTAGQLLALLNMSGSFEDLTGSSEPPPSRGNQTIWSLEQRGGSESCVGDWGTNIGEDMV